MFLRLYKEKSYLKTVVVKQESSFKFMSIEKLSVSIAENQLFQLATHFCFRHVITNVPK